ncbi:hypothetical protein [Pontiella sulfatireligans]|uniref:ATP-dependent DNA helicase RecG C-terminal domain-containing protein n=1 Tax=Pontiella sulfatireligans TaxID=2750658 RepID=A0A6C2UJC1_9BACT|nr:hypothetical protein [Pontiella sulfatireligans]VGO19973.1 hypothetical protein SCARR_02033 [Pontiella sulfatireligans]
MTLELLGIKNNPLLFGMLCRMNAVEQVGSGIRRIREKGRALIAGLEE